MILEEIINTKDKDISLEVDNRGLHISSKDKLTLYEYSYAMCIMLTYINSEIYGHGLTMEQSLEKGFKMYKNYCDGYDEAPGKLQ